jgi:hypothetical protein
MNRIAKKADSVSKVSKVRVVKRGQYLCRRQAKPHARKHVAISLFHPRRPLLDTGLGFPSALVGKKKPSPGSSPGRPMGISNGCYDGAE